MNYKYCLFKDITNTIKDCLFYLFAIIKGEKDTIEKIVLSMYKNNMQIRKKRDLSAFRKINAPLLWFLNIISCRR